MVRHHEPDQKTKDFDNTATKKSKRIIELNSNPKSIQQKHVLLFISFFIFTCLSVVRTAWSAQITIFSYPQDSHTKAPIFFQKK